MTLIEFISSPLYIAFSVLLPLFVIYQIALWGKSINSEESISLRRCPNPNCIRCQKYQIVQKSAKHKLPHLINQWKNENKGKDVHGALGKVIDGVRSGPPPLPSLNLKLRFLRYKQTNAVGQYPTVLFVPRLSVHLIATKFHQKACRLLTLSKHSMLETMMEEYVNSQFNGGLWQENDSGAIDATKNSNQLWEVLYLMNQGKWMKENTRSCNKTYSFVKQLHGLMENCMFGNVFFSVLYPGTKIEDHCGPTNVRHRLHFPLFVPSQKYNKNQPTLKIWKNKYNWFENEPFVFDDSLVHAAEYPQNDKSEVRVVLVVDLWHNELSLDEKQIISDLYPP